MSMQPLHIGIEARYVFAREKTGIENYTTQVVRELGRRPDLPPVTLYTDAPPEPVDEASAEILACPRLRVRVVPRRRPWLRFWLPLAARRDRVTVMHYPGTVVPDWFQSSPGPETGCSSFRHADLRHFWRAPFCLFHRGTPPSARGTRAVVTVHDLTALRLPELAYGNDVRVVNTVVRRSVLRSAHVLAVSRSTARDVGEFFGVPPARITVTYEAADPRYRRVANAGLRVAERFGLREPYVLFVGTPFRRKNLEGVMAALSQIGPAGDGVVLAVASRKQWAFPDVEQRAEALGVRERVRFLGDVPDEEMPALYSGARMLVHPAFYEGFGLTVLEAMACGTPVVTSNTSSLPEVAGEAALLVDPRRPDAIAGAIRRLLTDTDLRAALSRAGREQAARFTWERAAALTLEGYLAAARIS